MAPLTDPERLRHYRHAIRLWHVSGYVNFERRALEWVRQVLGVAARDFSRLICEHVDAGGEIDEVPETRPEYQEHEFHHDLRLTVGDRRIYVETRLLMERDIDDTTIQVVNVHDV